MSPIRRAGRSHLVTSLRQWPLASAAVSMGGVTSQQIDGVGQGVPPQRHGRGSGSAFQRLSDSAS
jgi:hypothetical protein